MTQASNKKGSILQFLAIFAVVYLLTQLTMKYVFPERYGNAEPRTGVMMNMVDATVKGQHHPDITITNATDTALILEDRCPMPPVLAWKVQADGERMPLETTETALPCTPLTSIAAGETVTVSLAPWKYSLFDDYGTYELELPAPEGTEVGVVDAESQYREGVITRFNYYEVGVVTQLFRTFITKPLLNGLILIASVMPGYNLGLAIIILTVIVKLLLFVPTQHALEGQRKMQLVQPKMDALKKKYKDDPKKMQEETMKIWKEFGVNPMQSCLPMLVQFPILIGLFFTIRDGSILALSQHLLYEPYQNLSWTFGTNFLGLSLTKPSVYIFPPLLMVMQFLQMKLSFAINKKKQEKQGKKQEKETMSQQEIQQKVMMYGLPLMIGFFAIRFPAAVSLYWGVSTVFAIFQQLYVNRKDLK